MSVAELHGVWASGGSKPCWIDIREVSGSHVQLSVPDYQQPLLTAAQARYLASKLNRLAKRIEQRAQPKEKTP